MIGTSRIAAKIAALEDSLIALQATVAAQAETIEALRKSSEGFEETEKQLWGHLARLDRQTTLDLEEMRQTSAAIAASVLLKHPSRGAEPTRTRDGS